MLSQCKKILEDPSYGYINNNELVVPKVSEVLREVVSRISILDRTKWLTSLIFIASVFFVSHLFAFFYSYFSWGLFGFMFLYALVLTSCYSNVWTHRYCVHRAYRINNRFFKFVISNLVIKAISEEIHVISHHVHHQAPDKPGDPYNPKGGFWYCFFSDFTHQNIRKDLSEKQYQKVIKMMEHTGVSLNSYEQYLYWGTVSRPLGTIRDYVVNWSIWYAVFFLIGGMPLVTVAFGALALWSLSYRTLNYRIHGGGKNKHIDGRDYHRKDLSINRMIPGFLAGEWHNNHHMFPKSARSGFLWYQLDLPWYFIKSMRELGMISSCNDNYIEFHKRKVNKIRRQEVSFGY